MRFGKRIIYGEYIIKTKFAWLPVTINGETRWLERVKIKGYYVPCGLYSNSYWVNLIFVD